MHRTPNTNKPWSVGRTVRRPVCALMPSVGAPGIWLAVPKPGFHVMSGYGAGLAAVGLGRSEKALPFSGVTRS